MGASTGPPSPQRSSRPGEPGALLGYACRRVILQRWERSGEAASLLSNGRFARGSLGAAALELFLAGHAGWPRSGIAFRRAGAMGLSHSTQVP